MFKTDEETTEERATRREATNFVEQAEMSESLSRDELEKIKEEKRKELRLVREQIREMKKVLVH